MIFKSPLKVCNACILLWKEQDITRSNDLGYLFKDFT
jgi:hypothetical protein